MFYANIANDKWIQITFMQIRPLQTALLFTIHSQQHACITGSCIFYYCLLLIFFILTLWSSLVVSNDITSGNEGGISRGKCRAVCSLLSTEQPTMAGAIAGR